MKLSGDVLAEIKYVAGHPGQPVVPQAAARSSTPMPPPINVAKSPRRALPSGNSVTSTAIISNRDAADEAAATLPLVAAGIGISIVPASLQDMNIRGVAYRRLAGSTPLKVPLTLASRRGDTSAVVRQFVSLVRRRAKNHAVT